MESSKDLTIDDAQKRLFSNILDIGINRTIAKKIMCFWMFLESKGFENIYKNILMAGEGFLPCVCAEAEIAFTFLERESNPDNPKTSISLPNTWKFASSSLSPADVLGDKEKVSDAILAFQNDFAFENLDVKMVAAEGSSQGSKLNPSAQEWSPAQAPEEERSLFMTLSKHGAVSKAEIVDYFKRQHGDCLEDVFIHTPRNRSPEFGKIVFKYSWIPNQILQDNDSVIIKIGEKTIGLKKYKAS